MKKQSVHILIMKRGTHSQKRVWFANFATGVKQRAPFQLRVGPTTLDFMGCSTLGDEQPPVH